ARETETNASALPLKMPGPSKGRPYVRQAERLFGQGLVDASNHFAYFSTVHEPGRILKIALGPAAETPPSVVGAVGLEARENNTFYAAADLPGRCALFATDYPGHLVKVALGAGAEPPYRVGSILLDEEYNVRVLVIDSGTGYACVNVGNRLYKIRLGKPDEAPSQVSVLELPTDFPPDFVSA